MIPAVVLLLWLVATLAWWAFAFMPLPTHPPEWLTTARVICFGFVDSGWPGPAGWILLVVAPATFLASIAVLWGSDLGRSLGRLSRMRAGRALLALLALAVAVEGAWVATKLRVASGVASATAAPGDLTAGLPPEAVRGTAPAPDFTLIDQRGETISLRRFRGQPVVLTFVFGHCQTMCPLLVETLKSAAGGNEAGAALLVTLDPWRDTVRTLPDLARRWGLPERVHVLSAPRVDDVLRVVRAYDMPYERSETTGDLVHPGLVFVIDAEGRLAFTLNNPPTGWVREALHRLRGPNGSAG